MSPTRPDPARLDAGPDDPARAGAPTEVGRRQVLCGLLVALAAPAALAACSSDTPAAAPPPAGTPLASIPVGGGLIVSGQSGPVLLVQPAAGRVVGYSAVCPHQGTTVNPPANGLITCPRHGSQFDPATGDLRHGPATRGLTTVPVQVQGDRAVLT